MAPRQVGRVASLVAGSYGILMFAGLATVWSGADFRGPEPGDPWPFRQGRVEIGVQAGGGASVQHDPRSGSVFALLPRVGYILHEFENGLPGSVQIAVQPTYLTVFQGSTAYVGGVAGLLKYNIRTETRMTPFLQLGAGVAGATRRTPSLGGYFNFILQAGVGVQYAINDRYTFNVEWLYQHLSNADLYRSNLGLNTSVVLVGVSAFY
jgi:hypothetical protein